MDARPPRGGGVLHLLPLLLILVGLSAQAGESGDPRDPSLILIGSAAVTFIVGVGGALVLAQYNRAVGAIDGRLTELRDAIKDQGKLLAATREDYARRGDLDRLTGIEATLRTELRAEDAAIRGELRTELGQVRKEMVDLRAEVGTIHADLQRVLAILSAPVGGAR